MPNPTEVERVFDVALAELADPAIFHEERWRFTGRSIPGSDDDSFPVWFFEVSGEMIWGATARMIHELLGVVLTLILVLGGATRAASRPWAPRPRVSPSP